MEGFLCTWAIVAICCALAGSAIGKRREAPDLGGLCGLLFGPLGVVIACLIDGRNRCPACKESVGKYAFLCSQCRTALVWDRGERGNFVPFLHPDAPLVKQLHERGIPAPVPKAKPKEDSPRVDTPPPPRPFQP